MSRFDRYMLSQLMMFFGFFALVLVSIYWVNYAVRLFDRLISDNQSVWVFLELSALSLPNVIRLMLPVAAFVAAIYATQRMVSESEFVVMQATGFSPFRLARPVLYFGLIVALLVAVLANLLDPMSRSRLNARNLEISDNISAKLLTEGMFQHPAPGLTLFIRNILPNGELNDLFLSDRRTPGTETIYTAKRAFLTRTVTGPKLVMVSGSAQTLRARDARLSVTRFDSFTYDISSLLAPKGPRTPGLDERMTPELLAAAPELLAETGASRAQAQARGHDRIAKPISAISLVLVGFAAMQIGSFSRFGMWRQISFAVGGFILLFLFSNVADRAAASGAAPALIAYLPALAGFALAALLLLWSMRRRAPAKAVPAAPVPA